ncbi:MAG: hypothetical protein IJV83_03160 [Clostridia bacterium]|nr:hypothetical protein [Clostridia bacterium]
MKNFFKKIKAYTWALILLVVVYFTAGMFTLGSTQTEGKAFYLEANKTAYFSISRGETGRKLDDIYVNIGRIYTVDSGIAKVDVKYYAGDETNPTSTSTKWTALNTVYFANGYSVSSAVKDKDAQFNWSPLALDAAKSRAFFSITSDVALEINEMVCLDQNGEKFVIRSHTPSTGSHYESAEKLYVCDAQDTFSLNKEFKYNFTQEEKHYLNSALTVMSGKTILDGAKYSIDADYNFLATLLFVPTLSMFGVNTFALRLPVFIASCVLLVFAALLIRDLTKSEKLSFAFATVLAFGGMLTTVGRIGVPYMFVASALVASLYFMHRFFARGISSKKVVKGATNVLLSGVFAALAMSMDVTAGLPVVGILVLFFFGLRRQKAAYALEMKKTGTADEKAVKLVREKYEEKNRIALGFAALSFIALTIFTVLISGVISYSAYVKARNAENMGFLTILFKQTVGSVRGFVNTEYLAGNASNVLAWWLPVKPATLYSACACNKYLAVSVIPNAIATYAAFASFVFVAVKVVLGYVKKYNDKQTLRLRRNAIVLFAGMLCAMVTATVRGGVTAETGILFHVFYLGFIALAATQLPAPETKKVKLLSNVAIWSFVGLVAVNFILSLPAIYGFAAPTGWAKAFGWTAWLNNGFFR